MPTHSMLRRRLLVRLALLFACAQVIAGAGVVFLLPAVRERPLAAVLMLILVAVDLAVLVGFSVWVIRGSVSEPVGRLATDVQRIADGDYHHRVGEFYGPELEDIRQSVNRMADRLIADQQLLAENVQSLDDTNRELVLARDQLVQAARLASVGTLAAGIAHEVGNPLGAIMAFVDVARKRTERDGGDPELLESIRAEAKRIDRIVRGLLDYSRPAESELASSAPAAVLDGVRELLDAQGKLDEAHVSWEIDEGAPDVVMEPQRLEQVMVNLMLNAFHALQGRPDPRISVRLYGDAGELSYLPRRREGDPPGVNYSHRRRVSRDDGGRGIVPAFSAQRVAVIEVSDNGPGIPEGNLEHVFDPFFTTKEPGEGTGLGLAICARLVDAMGGRIEVANRPEGGARFVIRLPGSGAPTSPSERSDEAGHTEETP